ncbi:MAG: ABC transporter permease [Candidatus Diapherotrites archaeon]|uniref:ABC transporter permease n=1 Tax=Candidatus Iainarchaeum sp. TaxID=3101447 RepID=A0A8T4L838_9ARCH|nr:ABC transporter permease [Candidatus Diapherotrites archaeon]
MDLEILSVAINNLRHQGLRSYLTLLGVIIGIASIFALVSIGDGLNASVTEQFEKLGSNTIFIAPGGTFSSGSGSPTATVTFKDSDIARLESYPEVKNVIPFFATSTVGKHGSDQTTISIFSYDPDKSESLEETGTIEVQEGRLFNNQDVFAAMVGEQFAEKAFSREIGLKNIIEINGKKYKIVGILKPSSQNIGGGGPETNNTVWIPEKGARQTFPNYASNFMFAQTFNKDQVASAKDKIQRYFDRVYGKDQTTVQTSEQLLDQIKQFLAIISGTLIVIALISLIVGGIGIMNAMVMTVLERTKEIGTMKALGATNTRIMTLFLLEAGLIGLVGGLLGSLLGFLIGQGMSIAGQAAGINLQAVATPELFLFVLAFSIIIGMISGAYPAWRASKMDPVVALRYE